MAILNYGVLKAWQNWVFVALVIMIVTLAGYLFSQATAKVEE